MTEGSHTSVSAEVEAFLSGAYQRIRRITIVLCIVAAITVTLWLGWRSGLGLAVGAIVGYLNFVWLHHASTMMTQRMITPAASSPSKFRLLLAFAGRYAFVIATAYVIFRGYPRMLAGFTAALFFPVIAAMFEGIYEVFASSKHR